MNNLKSVAFLLAVGIAVVVLGASFEGSNILERSIIVGVGIDYAENGLLFTAEVLSPSASEQVGTYSKTVTAYGKTCGDAIRQLAQLTGKEASLGQAVLLVLGESYYSTQNVTDVIDYFIRSDGFKENSVICCCKGKASDFLSSDLALEQSVSLALSQTILAQANNVAISTTNLLQFARSQRELNRQGFVNLVEYVPSQNVDGQNGNAKQGFFAFGQSVVFSDHEYLLTLNDYQTRGLALLDDEVKGETFVVNDGDLVRTVVVNGKSVDISLNGNAVNIDVTLYCKFARTESDETGGVFSSKNRKQLGEQVVAQVIEQAQNCIGAFLQHQTEQNFDVVGLHKAFRQKQGTTESLLTLPTSQIDVSCAVSVQEK